MISSVRNQVIVDGVPIYKVRYHIAKLLPVGGMYVLLEESPLGILYNNNITAISEGGELLWKAQVLVAASGAVDNPYMALWETDGELWASNWIGWAVQLSLTDGQIIQKLWNK